MQNNIVIRRIGFVGFTYKGIVFAADYVNIATVKNKKLHL